jgi:signal transduction histidine kinase
MRLSLSTRISLTIVGVLLLAVFSSVAAILSAYRFQSLQETIIAQNLASVRAAEELEISLLDQKGYVSSYMLDSGNRVWLDYLHDRLGDFDRWLREARITARSETEREILDKLEALYGQYTQKRNEVVTLYDAGQDQRARHILLHEVADLYRAAYDVCEELIRTNIQLVDVASTQVGRQVHLITTVVSVTAAITALLGLALLSLFFRGVLLPLRRLSNDARLATGAGPLDAHTKGSDEFGELGRFVQILMTDVAATRSDLKRSRDQLASAEKLAAVGKLAASVAHEIRNPLTAMKMWLYSLRKAISYDEKSLEKLNVVSGEMVRLENIVSQFLEFSRPPQLKSTQIRIGDLLNAILGLQKHLFEQHEIRIVRNDESDLIEICGDSEQLKQVFINLFNNAIEAMPLGGQLTVSTGRRQRGNNWMILIRIADTGCGMTDEVRQRVFEPFFTTKPEGTGLGLCIAAAILARHGGTLSLASSTSHGTTWDVWIPELTAPETAANSILVSSESSTVRVAAHRDG